MVSQREKRRMQEYVVEKLRLGGEKAEPLTKKLIAGRDINSSYILVGDNGIVLLVDQTYPEECFKRVYNDVSLQRNDKQEPRFSRKAVVFYKDGKTFFRSSMAGRGGKAELESMRFKQKYKLSLKNYSTEDLRKMITFRPEEILAFNSIDSLLQYYQPKSERLEEGIISYNFTPVHFDYSHLAGIDFRPSDTDSKRLHIWESDNFNGNSLFLGEKLLHSQKPNQSR